MSRKQLVIPHSGSDAAYTFQRLFSHIGVANLSALHRINTPDLPSAPRRADIGENPQDSLTKNRSMSHIHPAIEETPTPENVCPLLGRTRDRIVPISIETITTIEAVGGVAVVNTVGGSFILRETLATLEKVLPGDTFARMNQSLILNISQIEELQVLGGGGNHVQMKDGRIVALTLQLSEMESLLRPAIT